MTPAAPPTPRLPADYLALTKPDADPARISDTHWLMARFGRQAEATAGLGWTAWRQWLETSRAGLAAQWAALKARVGQIQRKRGR